MNRKNSHFKMKSNHFTDMSDEEFETHVGSMTKFDSRNHTGMKALHKHDPVYLGSAPKPVDVPDELDWRDYGKNAHTYIYIQIYHYGKNAC